MDIYGSLFRHVLFPVWETHLRKRPVVERWRALRRTQWASLDELHAIQTREVSRLIDHAYRNVPMYRALFEERGLTPSDVRTPEDLGKLPLLRRAELRAAGTARASTVPPLPTIQKQTSGTTGEPLLFGFEPDSEHWRRAVKYRGYEWAGYRPGDRALFFWGAPLPTPPPLRTRLKTAFDRHLHRERYVHCAVMREDDLDRAIDVIRTTRPKVLVCYAQAGAELARYVNARGVRTWDALPVICGAERVTAGDRADLEAAFGPVFDVYGCREVMMIGGECEAHAGYHLSMENLVVEIVITENGRERLAREGETGEVVFTDLHNFGMPFIRYANGDVATAGSSRPCACGRTLPRIESITGRVSETLHDANGAAVSGVALGNIFYDVSAALRQFQIVQHRDLSVTIRVVPVAQLPLDAIAQIGRNAEKLLAGVRVSVEEVPDLPRSAAGKHHLVVVERD